MKKQTFIWAIAAIIALGGASAYWYYHLPPTAAPAIPPATPAVTSVTYYCQEGSIRAEYGTSSVKLFLTAGRTLSLPQTISGSGIRYEQGKIVWVSKGDNAGLTENSVTTYTDCVAGTQAADNDTNTYTDAAKTFSFAYPNKFVLSGGDIGYSQAWSAESSQLGLLLAVVNIPRSFLPQTNFGEAKFTVGTSVDPDAVKNCLTADDSFRATSTQTVINGQTFAAVNFTDVGAGNYYDITSYRTIYDGQCYAVEYTIHSSNIYNYSPDQGISQFDRAKVATPLESMARSFKFLGQ